MSLRVDHEGLERELGCPVISVSAKTGAGLPQLRQTMDKLLQQEQKNTGFESQWPADEIRTRARDLARVHGPRSEVLLRSQNRLDHFLLGGFWGGVCFFAAMTFLLSGYFYLVYAAYGFLLRV